MAVKKVGLEVNVNGSQAEKSVGSIRQELRQATQDAIALGRKFGELSPEALDAAKKVAKLRDEVGDFKARVDALNPDAKFKAFSQSLQGVAGGFAGLQGAVGLFGTESEELQKQLLKVQSALALSQGLDSLLEARDSFKTLATLIKGNVVKAFSSLKGAIISTGIGALVVGVGLLISNFDQVKEVMLKLIPGLADVGKFIGKIVDSVTDFVGVTSDATRAYDKLKASTKGQNEEIDRQVKLLQAQGGNEKKIAELQKKKVDNNIKLIKSNKDATTEEKNSIKDLENEKAVISASERKRIADENKQKQQQRAQERKQEIAEEKQKQEAIRQAIYDSDKELTLARLDGREKDKKQLEIEEKEALEKVKGNAIATQNIKDLYAIKGQDLKKQFAEEDKKAEEDLKAFREEVYLDSFKNQEARAEAEGKLALEKRIKEIEDSKLTAVEKEQATQDAIDAWQQTQDQKNLDKKLTKDAEALASDQVSFEEKYAILAQQEALITELYANDEATRTKMLDENAKARKTITEKEAEAKVAVLESVAQTTAILSDAMGKDTAAGKALAVAQALINTYQGITAGVKLGFPKAIPAVLAASVTGFKAVKQILAVKVPNGGGGGGGNTIPTSSPIPTAPIASAVQVTQTQSVGTTDVNVQNQSAVKAFVVERDITDSQDRISKIKAAATI